MREIILDISKIVFGGAGFGHVDGKACFVPFTMPGDRVRVRVVKEKGSYIEAELIELLNASSQRIKPFCPAYGTCGGCALQHLSYDHQLAVKEELFAEQLWRLARVDPSLIQPMRKAEHSIGYRTRVQIKVRWIDNDLKVGFYRSGTHYIEPFPGCCAIAHPAINGLVGEFPPIIREFSQPDRIPQVDITIGEDGKAIVIIHYIGSTPSEAISYFSGRRSEFPSAAGLFLQIGRKNTLQKIWGIDRLDYVVPAPLGDDGIRELRLGFSAGGFSQINRLQNLQLIRIVSSLSGLTGRERVLDLFCGNGNFSLPLALNSRELIGADDYAQSIADASRNAKENNVQNVSFEAADATIMVQKLVSRGERFDVVILDPPRTGSSTLMKHLTSLAPRRIIYVSCNPATLGRDIAILKKVDYSVIRAVPVDMFPQTAHIESVTLLERD